MNPSARRAKVSARRASAVPTTMSEPSRDDLERDMTTLINLGLKLADIQRLWSQLPGIDPSDVHAIASRLLPA